MKNLKCKNWFKLILTLRMKLINGIDYEIENNLYEDGTTDGKIYIIKNGYYTAVINQH